MLGLVAWASGCKQPVRVMMRGLFEGEEAARPARLCASRQDVGANGGYASRRSNPRSPQQQAPLSKQKPEGL